MNTKVSVIVPMYNCSEFIERCSRSLFEQTFREEIEFVFINDGSTDNSVDKLIHVLDLYPKRKGQCVLIEHSQNKGIAFTRREGVHVATGEYICWCDSDDWVDSEMYMKMYAATLKGYYDIVVCNYIEEYANHQNYWKYKGYSSPQQALAEFDGLGFSFSLWTKMTKRSLMRKALDFIYPTNYGEDSFASIFLFSQASSVCFLKDFFYHYDRTNEVSIMHTTIKSQDLWLQQKENINRLADICKSIKNTHSFFRNYKKVKKSEFRCSFANIWNYYWTYRECSLNLAQYRDYAGWRMLYVWLVNNFFPLYWLYNRKTWNQ